MSIVKSFSVGYGDMFYIKHNSENFTVIDCYIDDENENDIISEIKRESEDKIITRFISTHPDDDHIKGLKKYNEKAGIKNFYCVKNETTKKDSTEDFNEYCKLRDGEKSFWLYKGCRRCWLNMSGEDNAGQKIETSGISILWPDCNNKYFKEALEEAKDGGSPNNISPIIRYAIENGPKILWFGDLEEDFFENIKEDLDIDEADIVFAPHHGRTSGKIPTDILEMINPKLIIIGEAPSEYLYYYPEYNTITQNSSGDIILDCGDNVDIYVSNANYGMRDYLKDNFKSDKYGGFYIGTLEI